MCRTRGQKSPIQAILLGNFESLRLDDAKRDPRPADSVSLRQGRDEIPVTALNSRSYFSSSIGPFQLKRTE